MKSLKTLVLTIPFLAGGFLSQAQVQDTIPKGNSAIKITEKIKVDLGKKDNSLKISNNLFNENIIFEEKYLDNGNKSYYNFEGERRPIEKAKKSKMWKTINTHFTENGKQAKATYEYLFDDGFEDIREYEDMNDLNPKKGADLKLTGPGDKIKITQGFKDKDKKSWEFTSTYYEDENGRKGISYDKNTNKTINMKRFRLNKLIMYKQTEETLNFVEELNSMGYNILNSIDKPMFELSQVIYNYVPYNLDSVTSKAPINVAGEELEIKNGEIKYILKTEAKTIGDRVREKEDKIRMSDIQFEKRVADTLVYKIHIQDSKNKKYPKIISYKNTADKIDFVVDRKSGNISRVIYDYAKKRIDTYSKKDSEMQTELIIFKNAQEISMAIMFKYFRDQ